MMQGSGHNQQLSAKETDALVAAFGAGDGKVAWRAFADTLETGRCRFVCLCVM
jgi:hypothetical protein